MQLFMHNRVVLGGVTFKDCWITMPCSTEFLGYLGITMRTPGMVKFEDWTQGRFVSSLGTNSGSQVIPFQGWHHFKEAFAPEIVARAIAESEIEVNRCLDPFGGSGTTALACQFLGVHPVIVEVNPYLADLIRAKLSQYNVDYLARDLRVVLREARTVKVDPRVYFSQVPVTFLEPGLKGRWLFNSDVSGRLAALLSAIDKLDDASHRCLFRVLLGGILISVSNVVISGKGRRYRRGWENRRTEAQNVDVLFGKAVHQALVEIHQYAGRALQAFDLMVGDCRSLLQAGVPAELVIFSPPYPNSFDYTDVYNVELWILGYLQSSTENIKLRRRTLSSHVQVSRNFSPPPSGAPTLNAVLANLDDVKGGLWDVHIPEMVGGYFSDLQSVLSYIKGSLKDNGKVWMIVGESCYSGVKIKTAQIISELSEGLGFVVDNIEPFRSMRSSAQQGGRHELAEELVVIAKRPCLP